MDKIDSLWDESKNLRKIASKSLSNISSKATLSEAKVAVKEKILAQDLADLKEISMWARISNSV